MPEDELQPLDIRWSINTLGEAWQWCLDNLVDIRVTPDEIEIWNNVHIGRCMGLGHTLVDAVRNATENMENV